MNYPNKNEQDKLIIKWDKIEISGIFAKMFYITLLIILYINDI